SKLAKVKTVIQMVMVIVLIVNLPSFSNLLPWLWFLNYFRIIEVILIYAALILTVVSLLEYLIRNRNVMKGPM
ncbi:MAG: hypothetical protein IK088_01615, partial [Lachnospiraceae bacterium]|nr:hypothetical protein [Lachnospiraceae bacterium]